MKCFFYSFAILFTSSFLPAFGGDWVREALPVIHVYVPHGFDSNDTTEILISGYRPDNSYQNEKAAVRVIDQTIFIDVTAERNINPNLRSIQIVTSFLLPARPDLPLDPGKYSIVVNGNTRHEKLSEIHIAAATSPGVDDNIYPNVKWVERIPGSRKIILHVEQPGQKNCFKKMSIDPIINGDEWNKKVKSNPRVTDTLSLKPRLIQVKANCDLRKTHHFEWEYTVPEINGLDVILLHIRIWSRRSINVLFANASI